jgi:hypothetical protein
MFDTLVEYINYLQEELKYFKTKYYFQLEINEKLLNEINNTNRINNYQSQLIKQMTSNINKLMNNPRG